MARRWGLPGLTGRELVDHLVAEHRDDLNALLEERIDEVATVADRAKREEAPGPGEAVRGG